MIYNQWYAILESKELQTKPLGIQRFNEKLILWRTKDSIHCLFDRCCHRGVQLSKGILKEDHIQCPFHGLEFDGRGRCVLIPANGKDSDVPEAFMVKSYVAMEKGGFVWVFWGEPDLASQKEIPYFEQLDTMAYMTLTDTWNVHYSRVIENQLDVVHLPFIHATTIGKGNKTLVNGPKVTWDGKELNTWATNAVDNGQHPLKATEMTVDNQPVVLRFRFPNLWMNDIAEKIKVVIAFVPVSSEETKLYIRFYQSMTKVPILKELFLLSGIWGSLVIERQDKRVVITQMPKRSALRSGEHLIQGDSPIIQYRKIRQGLIDEGPLAYQEL